MTLVLIWIAVVIAVAAAYWCGLFRFRGRR